MMDKYMQNFFDRPFGMLTTDMEKDMKSYNPRVDVTEAEDAIHVKAELPGMNEDDVEVTLDHDRLTIKGEKKYEKKGEDKDRRYDRPGLRFSGNAEGDDAGGHECRTCQSIARNVCRKETENPSNSRSSQPD